MRHFESREESTAYFKAMWKHGKNYHNTFPDMAMAIKYSSPESAPTWLKNVSDLYDRYNAR